MPKQLIIFEKYNRKEVHDIFDPLSHYSPQAGTWGLHGIVRIPNRPNDFIFFVTYGQSQGNHTFNENITKDGILTWQSQPRHKLSSPIISQFINHDHDKNNIYLFLRKSPREDYLYLGRLAYVTHDREKENPVYFKWQILEWDLDKAIENNLIKENVKNSNIKITPQGTNRIIYKDPPVHKREKQGVSSQRFTGKHVDFAENEKKNKQLGDLGEELVLKEEKRHLISNGLEELAKKVFHTAKYEGDGAGYDILSFNEDGTSKYIEVKTTKGGERTPFMVSSQELAFSKLNPENYYLYRIYDFDPETMTGKAYILKGDLEKHVDLKPITYKAYR